MASGKLGEAEVMLGQVDAATVLEAKNANLLIMVAVRQLARKDFESENILNSSGNNCVVECCLISIY